jgi:hypothetical protein
MSRPSKNANPSSAQRHNHGLIAAETALSVLVYNLTRVMNIVGIKPLIAAIAA